MTEVVIDTNVLVSGLLSPTGDAAAILQMVASGQLRPEFDDRILAEYKGVLGRQKFGFSSHTVDMLLESMERVGLRIIPFRAPGKLPDESDRPFYECAMMSDSGILITGNTRHFPAKICVDIHALSPGDFLDALDENASGNR